MADDKQVEVKNVKPRYVEVGDVIYDTSGQPHTVDDVLGNHIFFTDGTYAVTGI